VRWLYVFPGYKYCYCNSRGTVLVCSFFGVILIARPRSLFGSRKGELSEVVMPWQRMFSVVFGVSQLLSRCFLSCHVIALRSLVSWERLVPVSHLSATWIYALSSFLVDTILRAIGKRAHSLHSLAYFSLQSVIFSTIGYVPPFLLKGQLTPPILA
jgi:hypothetical protein